MNDDVSRVVQPCTDEGVAIMKVRRSINGSGRRRKEEARTRAQTSYMHIDMFYHLDALTSLRAQASRAFFKSRDATRGN